MMIKKKYYLLEEVANYLGCEKNDLIYQGAHKGLPIHVLPKGWNVDIVTTQEYEASMEAEPFSSPQNPHNFWASVDEFHEGQIIQPVQIHPYTLLLLNADAATETRYFFLDSVMNMGEIIEYRLSDYVSGQPQMAVSLSECTLVILDWDFQKLFSKQEKIDSMPTEKKEGEKDVLELGGKKQDTLLKKIGVLALVIAHLSKKYQIGENPNASSIAECVKDTLDHLESNNEQQKPQIQINKHGLSTSSIRTSIKEGLELLVKQ